MRSAQLLLLVLCLSVSPLTSGCASLTPRACRPVCENPDAEPCQQCIAREEQKREEARRKREEEREHSSPPSYPVGGSGGPY